MKNEESPATFTFEVRSGFFIILAVNQLLPSHASAAG